MTEPWLRGPIANLHPAAAHLLYTFQQTREELLEFCANLPTESLWQIPTTSVASVGFHLRHIAGSVNRLTTYLQAQQLDDLQLTALRSEQEPGASFKELMNLLEIEFHRAEDIVRAIPPTSYQERRTVGRKQLPTTVGGLIIHISEHTQRHLGQAIIASKLVR